MGLRFNDDDYGNKRKIVLIVDNPPRDLEGMTSLAREFAKNDALCFLVSMYDQSVWMSIIKPTDIIINYYRKNNKKLIEYYRAMGARVYVLDTEGNGGENINTFAKELKKEGVDGKVDGYFLWGREQYECFKENRVIFDINKLHLTGAPRLDLYTKKYRDYISPVKFKIRSYILFNTNFPIINPRYNKNTEDNIADRVRAGDDEVWIRGVAAEAKYIYKKYLEVIEEVATTFKEITIIIRPHPFERREAYDWVGNQHKNVLVIQEGTTVSWIKNALVLVHLNCATAIEAVVMGKPVIAMEWFNQPLSVQSIPRIISVNAQNLEDLINKIKIIINSDSKTDYAEQVPGIIERRYVLDGDSSKRIVAEILKNKLRNKWRSYRLIKQRPKEILRCILGPNMVSKIKYKFGLVDQEARNGKTISQNYVCNVIDNINVALDDKSCFIINTIKPCHITRWYYGEEKYQPITIKVSNE